MLMKIAALIILLNFQAEALVLKPQPLVAKKSSAEIKQNLKLKILAGEINLTCGVGSHG